MTRVERSAHYAWIVVALLLPVALLNYLDRQMLATMKASMVGDIPTIANRADWGLILGSFKWTYALLGPIAGYISDRFSRRWVIGASVHGNQRGVLLSGRSRTDHRVSPRPHALARRRGAPGRRVSRADHRRVRRICRGIADARLALGVLDGRDDRRDLRDPAARAPARRA